MKDAESWFQNTQLHATAELEYDSQIRIQDVFETENPKIEGEADTINMDEMMWLLGRLLIVKNS